MYHALWKRGKNITYLQSWPIFFDNGIDIGVIGSIGVNIDIDKALFKLLMLVLILIRSLTNY